MSSPTHAVAVPEAPAKAAPYAVNPARLLRLQRKCACGGQCDDCKKKEPQPVLQRKSVPGAPSLPAAAPRTPVPPAAHAPAPAAAHGPATAPSPAAAPAPAPAAAPAPAKAAPKAAAGSAVPASPAPAAPRPAPKPPAPAKAAEPKASDRPTPEKDKPKSATPAITEKKKTGDPVSDLPPIVRRVLDTPGEPLDFATRTAMEARFGHSFRDVRIHTDSLAAESARAVYAHAYTVGEHVVFDTGQYQPQTPQGQHLLAHELAHTVQQHGLQKSGPIASDKSGDYPHLESEADAAARSVMDRPRPGGAPVSPARAAQPRLSRADQRTEPKSPGKEAANKDDQDSWIPVKKGSPLAIAGVREVARLKSDPDLVAVQMSDPFEVPRKKGPKAMALWEAQANAGALQAIMAPGSSESNTSAALKQDRPVTDDLRDLWLEKMGWPKGTAAANKLWKAAARKADFSANTSTFRPSTKVGAQTCDFDHILELQFGGNNVPMNIQVLDSSPNRSSGALIGAFLRAKAFGIRKAMQQDDPTSGKDKVKTTAIRMQFGSVVLSKAPEPECKCCKVEEAGKDPELLKDQKGDAKTGPRYPMRSAAFSACVIADADDEVDLHESGIAENKAAATIIPGLLLDTWTLPKNKSAMETCADGAAAATETPEEGAKPKAMTPAGKGKGAAKAAGQAGGKVSAKLDPDARILKSLKLKKGDTVELLRDASGHLAMPDKKPRLGFFLNYLSEGSFTRLTVGDDGSLSGAGEVTPSLSFLPKPIEVEFDKEHFVMSTQVKKPTLPIPGVEITECSIGLQIAPEFKPEGKVGFRVAPGGKQILHGLLTVSADENGLVVNGDVFASIPGVDEAKGNLTLKNKEWSGGIDIKAGDFGSKLKYIKSGEVSIRFSQQQGMSASGKVELAVPGVTDPVIASVLYDRDGWSYRAKARFNPPRIKPVDIELEYAHDHLSGEGTTGFEFHKLSGTIHVRYRDEMFFGDGTLAVKTDRADGSLKVEMHHRPNGDLYFTGEGTVSFKVTDDLVATAGIKIDEQEKVQFLGELAFPKPITLWNGFRGNYDIFSVSIKIPIPGASIGPVGLEAVIRGALSAGYDVGPVQLLDTKATASFQPLEPDPKVEMQFQSRLHMHASVHVTGSISGDIAIDIAIASVSGGLTLSATAQLAGDMDAPLTASYKDGKISADVGFQVSLALAILLALSAHVRAEAGVGPFTVSTEKDWTLATYTYDPGLSFGMKLKKPIHYETGGQLQLPSIEDIDWTKPQINAKDALQAAFGQGSSK
jgi:hypothetical protein